MNMLQSYRNVVDVDKLWLNIIEHIEIACINYCARQEIYIRKLPWWDVHTDSKNPGIITMFIFLP